MQFKVVTLLLPFCLFQAVLSSEITPEDRLKLAAAQDDIILAIRTTAIELNTVDDIVNQEIDLAVNETKHALNELKQEVLAAQQEAIISGKDIQICVDAENKTAEVFHDKIKSSLKECRNLDEGVAQIELNLHELGSLKALLVGAETTCTLEVDASKCVNDLIDNAELNKDRLVTEIEDILPTIDVNVQLACVATVHEDLKTELENIITVWRTCISQQ